MSGFWRGGENGYLGSHMSQGQGGPPSWPIPGVRHGRRQLSCGAGEHTGSPRHLGSQPPGPAAWRVSSRAAGVGEAPLRGTGKHP